MPPLFCWLPSVCIALCLHPPPPLQLCTRGATLKKVSPRELLSLTVQTRLTLSRSQQSQQLCRQKMLRTMRAAVAQAFVLVLCVLLPGGCFSAALLRVPASCMWPCLHARA